MRYLAIVLLQLNFVYAGCCQAASASQTCHQASEATSACANCESHETVAEPSCHSTSSGNLAQFPCDCSATSQAGPRMVVPEIRDGHHIGPVCLPLYLGFSTQKQALDSQLPSFLARAFDPGTPPDLRKLCRLLI